MAKKSLLGTMLTIGGIAAATYVVYQNREEIRDLAKDMYNRIFPEKPAEDCEPAEEETDIVIDATEEAGAEETEVVEETAEE